LAEVLFQASLLPTFLKFLLDERLLEGDVVVGTATTSSVKVDLKLLHISICIIII
jgi:hypothetical protein